MRLFAIFSVLSYQCIIRLRVKVERSTYIAKRLHLLTLLVCNEPSLEKKLIYRRDQGAAAKG